MVDEEPTAVSAATVARLPLYLRGLIDLRARGTDVVSSDQLGQYVHVRSGTVRRDLSNIGLLGTRGVGYDVAAAVHELTGWLGLTEQWPVAIVGAGNLGSALAAYPGFEARGFPVMAIFDADPGKVGRTVGRLPILHINLLPDTIASMRISIGIVATPASEAQGVTDMIVAAGVKSILSFAPTMVGVPPDVNVRAVDLANELQILAFHAWFSTGKSTPTLQPPELA